MKKNIGLVFGGPGVENEISIISAKSIFENIDKSKFEIFLILMNYENKFILIQDMQQDIFSKIKSSSYYNFENSQAIYFVQSGFWANIGNCFQKLDSVFNIIHGELGEDGKLCGFFDVLKIPYVGSDHKSSAVLMDKGFTYEIAKQNDINILDFEIAFSDNIKSFEFYEKKLGGMPFFIKASNAGSSRGVFKIKSKSDFEECLKEIFNFDKKIIIQKGLELPREIELAAFMDDKGFLEIASSIGEIKPSKKHGFYSYEAKYFDSDGAELIVDPVDFNEVKRLEFFELTRRLFKIFGCSMGRIDFFLSDGAIYFNEINALPGFTSISMFPALFQKSGMKYSELLTKLIENSLTYPCS